MAHLLISIRKVQKDDRRIKSGSTTLDIVSKQTNRTDVVQLIEQFQNNPKETQKNTRKSAESQR